MIGQFEAKIAAALIALTLAFGGGFMLEHMLKNGEIAAIELAQQTALNKAQAALIAANAANTALERAASTATAAAAEAYEKGEQNAKATNEPLIADLRAGNRRLLVSLAAIAANGQPVPGTATTASGSDGASQGTLSGPVAARLAGRYADYNENVRRLTLCQATVNAYRLTNAKH